MFIPNSMIDLRERFPQPNSKRRATLSPAAQCTVLYHLLREPLTGISLKDIARKIHYSPMRMTKVKDELEASEICKVVKNGRSMVLDFKATGRALWEQVKPQLTSPVKKTRWVQWAKPVEPALLAGMSALSLRTMIAADRLPTYALPVAVFQEFLERGVCASCHDAENAAAKIEIWSYNPHLLGDDRMVDPLSLYLSLRNSSDERVQQQLEQLIGEIKW
jgi:DNA-binding MarR family transcriptional regulator